MIELITRTNCFYCNQAKSLLQEKRYDYQEHIIGENITRDEVIAKYPEQKMLPIVIIDGTLIGSWAELLDWVYPAMSIEDNE